MAQKIKIKPPKKQRTAREVQLQVVYKRRHEKKKFGDIWGEAVKGAVARTPGWIKSLKRRPAE